MEVGGWRLEIEISELEEIKQETINSRLETVDHRQKTN